MSTDDKPQQKPLNEELTEAMGMLLLQVARTLVNKFKEGTPEARDVEQAIKFLKNNNITFDTVQDAAALTGEGFPPEWMEMIRDLPDLSDYPDYNATAYTGEESGHDA